MIKRFKVLAVTAVGGMLLLSACSSTSTTSTSLQEAVSVQTITAQAGEINGHYTVSGRAEAYEEVGVVSKISGRVSEVGVDIGDRVHKGDVLVRLDAKEMEAQIAQAQAGVQAAQANLNLVASGARPQELQQAEESVAKAEAAVQSAQSGYDLAKTTFDRDKALFEAGALSKQQMDQSKAQLEAAEQQLATAKSGLGQAQASLSLIKAGAKPEQIQAARAQVEQAQAALRLVQTQYENTLIKAPIDGEVAARNIDPGEMANPGESLITLVNTGKMRVNVNVDEGMVNYISASQSVPVAFTALPGVSMTGKVTAISPKADSVSKSFPVRIEVDNPEGRLKVGMFAQVNFPIQLKQAVVVPDGAVVEQSGQTIVYVVADGKAAATPVGVLRTDGNTAILSGVQPGDQIVVDGQKLLADGMSVTAEPYQVRDAASDTAKEGK